MFGQDNKQDSVADATNGFMPPTTVQPGSSSTDKDSGPAAGGYSFNPPAAATTAPTTPATPDTSSDSDETSKASSAPAPQKDDLLGIKQEALQQLTPLVSHLDQPPEEKFRTLMMMIQAADDHTKLKEAFDTAKQISDDKVRAQALLDVINEINYFTQQNGS